MLPLAKLPLPFPALTHLHFYGSPPLSILIGSASQILNCPSLDPSSHQDFCLPLQKRIALSKSIKHSQVFLPSSDINTIDVSKPGLVLM